MTGPHLRKPWTETEQRIVHHLMRSETYERIGVLVAQETGRPKPLTGETIRKYTRVLADKIDMGPEHEGWTSDLSPPELVRAYYGWLQFVATTRERFYKSA